MNICIYHNADMDGHCSGAIVRKALPDTEMLGLNYGNPYDIDKLLSCDGKVIIVDFSLKPQHMLQLFKQKGEDFIWCDHHASAIKHSIQHGYNEALGSRSEHYAACYLTWNYFFPGKPTSRPVKWMSDYDIWKHEDSYVLPFQYGIRNYATDPSDQTTKDMWEFILEDAPSVIDTILDQGQIIFDYEQKQNARISKAVSYDVNAFGYTFLVANRSHCNSKFFDAVFDPEKHDAMCMFSWMGDMKQWTISMYTPHDNVDILAIALQFWRRRAQESLWIPN